MLEKDEKGLEENEERRVADGGKRGKKDCRWWKKRKEGLQMVEKEERGL